MWRPYGKESHSTRGSRECFGCVFDLRACTRQAVSLTPLYVMVLVSVCARRRAGPPVHVYDRAACPCTRGAQRPGRSRAVNGPTGPRSVDRSEPNSQQPVSSAGPTVRGDPPPPRKNPRWKI